MDYLTTHTSLSPIRRGFALGFVNFEKGCTLLAATSDKVYQLLAHGRWFYPGTPASSTTKTGRHDKAEILLKVALKHQKSKSKIKSTMIQCYCYYIDTFESYILIKHGYILHLVYRKDHMIFGHLLLIVVTSKH